MAAPIELEVQGMHEEIERVQGLEDITLVQQTADYAASGWNDAQMRREVTSGTTVTIKAARKELTAEYAATLAGNVALSDTLYDNVDPADIPWRVKVGDLVIDKGNRLRVVLVHRHGARAPVGLVCRTDLTMD